MSDLNSVQEQLAKPFDETEIKWKPQVTTKGKTKEPIMRGNQQVAGCTAHIDARAVMTRLDDVVGAGGWSDSYKVLDGKHVECTLTVLGISKSDVGETNEGGFADPVKSAYSDALKRAAVKFGIGRHLYEMEMEWLPFDGYRIIENPPTQKSGQKPQALEPGTWPHVEAGGATNGDARGNVSPGAQAERDPRRRVSKPAPATTNNTGFAVGDVVVFAVGDDEVSGEVKAVNGDKVTVVANGRPFVKDAADLSKVEA